MSYEYEIECTHEEIEALERLMCIDLDYYIKDYILCRIGELTRHIKIVSGLEEFFETLHEWNGVKTSLLDFDNSIPYSLENGIWNWASDNIEIEGYKYDDFENDEDRIKFLINKEFKYVYWIPDREQDVLETIEVKFKIINPEIDKDFVLGLGTQVQILRCE